MGKRAFRYALKKGKKKCNDSSHTTTIEEEQRMGKNIKKKTKEKAAYRIHGPVRAPIISKWGPLGKLISFGCPVRCPVVKYLFRHMELEVESHEFSRPLLSHLYIPSLMYFSISLSLFAHLSVIRLMLQFCKENNLLRTMATLQEESQVGLNTVDTSVDGFMSDVTNGRWDNVLSAVATMRLHVSKLINLYEQVF